jgi:uncharacterized membrane protein
MAMAGKGGDMPMDDAVAAGGRLALPVRSVGVDRPWAWLVGGWQDMRRAARVSLAYGVLFVAASFVLTLGLWLIDMLYLVLPLAAGFMLLGPLIAVGLYEVSRRLEAGEPVDLHAALFAWRAHRRELAGMGVILMLFLLAWVRIAFLLFALFFGPEPPSWDRFISVLFFSAEGVPFLLTGSAVGGVLAVIVFAISAVAIPLLLDRDVGVIAAVATSVRAVLVNWRVMIGWGALIVLFTAGGLATGYLGLAVTLPLIGHATWHAYRDLVAPAV